MLEEISQILSSVLQAETSKRRKKNLYIYIEGLKQKMRQMDYSLERIRYYSQQTEFEEKTEDVYSVEEKLSFYIDGFWTFSMSIFDILSQVANQVERLGLEEKKVDLEEIIKLLNKNTRLFKELEKTKKSNTYKNIKKYRNTSTHRRQTYIRVETKTIRETSGYSTATGPRHKQVCYLADNPNSLVPKIREKREVNKFCVKIAKDVKEKVKKIVKLL